MNLAKPYSQQDFLEFLKDFLPDFEKDIAPVNILHEFKTIVKVTQLGRSEALDLDIYEFKAVGKSQKKISQAIESFKIIKQQMSFRALVSYQGEDDLNWRLALLQMTPDLSEEGKRTQKFSNPRRYSFLLGPTAKIKTPTKFLDLAKKITDFSELEKRFSVEVVNKDFYNQIAHFFSRLTGGDRKSGSKQLHFDSEMTLPSQNNPDKSKYQEFTVRLIGRIIFCWFLKQKKSKNGLSLLPEEYLSSDAVRANSDYYHTVLEKVFFEVLNKPITDRNSEVRNGYDTIPYLNGGLFDPHSDDYYSDQPFWTLSIPNKWFEEFFEVLETYNFTIDENTVIDTDLSIDPEMLGRIFENLLAEINPETGESARKSTGSYYTPRPIVEYMVDQSLIQYLLTKTAISEEKIKALVSIDLEDDESYPLTQDEKIKVVNALDTVKIIDPACGSGAFPIGILQKIVFILGQTDPDGRLWFEKKLEGLDSVLAEDLRNKFEKENFDYIRKTGVIKDSIYGVDIQSIAVEVSKLRCFLTLVVDEEIDDSDPKNRGIKPLPNLEFKFVAANTLIELPGVKQNGLFENKDHIDQLKTLRDKYFVASGYQKIVISSKFKDVQKDMFRNQIFVQGQGEMTMALADWDPFKNESSDWFDPEWMYGVANFDIIIGNPPYGFRNVLTPKEKEFFRKIRKIEFSSGDSAELFCKICFDNLLSENGILTFIIPKKSLYGDAWEGFRRNYWLKNNLHFLLDSSKAFGDVLLEANAFGLSKNKMNSIIECSYLDKNGSIAILGHGKKDEIFLENSTAQVYLLKIPKTFWNKIQTTKIDDKLVSGKLGLAIGTDFYSDTEKEYKLLKGIDIGRWKIKSNRWLKNKQKLNWKQAEEFLKPKIVAQVLVAHIENPIPHIKVTASYDREGIIITNTLMSFVLSEKILPEFWLAYLNSSFVSWYAYNFIYARAVRTMHLYDFYIQQIPVPKAILEQGVQDRFISIIDSIEATVSSSDYKTNLEKQSKVKECEKQINQMIYKLYDLTSAEIEIIEESQA